MVSFIDILLCLILCYNIIIFSYTNHFAYFTFIYKFFYSNYEQLGPFYKFFRVDITSQTTAQECSKCFVDDSEKNIKGQTGVAKLFQHLKNSTDCPYHQIAYQYAKCLRNLGKKVITVNNSIETSSDVLINKKTIQEKRKEKKNNVQKKNQRGKHILSQSGKKK